MIPIPRLLKPAAGIALAAAFCYSLISSACHAAKDDKTPPSPEQVEKLTMQSGAEFYGWQLKQDSFFTCEQRELAIAGGTITKTARSCDEGNSPVIPLLSTLPGQFQKAPPSVTGPVVRVNPKTQTFSLKLPGEETTEFFVPQSAGPTYKTMLDSLKPGDKVTVTQVSKGRAEQITKDTG